MILEDTIMYRRSAKTPEDVANWKLVYNFIVETKYFLEHYDSIVETWDLCDQEFMIYLWEVEERLIELLYKYTTVTTDYLRPINLPTVEIKCCNRIFKNSIDLLKHYYTVHHTPAKLNEVRYCEMKAGLLKLDFYRRSLKYYTEYGTWCDHVLCLYLKRIYKKVLHTLEPFRDTRDVLGAADLKGYPSSVSSSSSSSANSSASASGAASVAALSASSSMVSLVPA
ncbi:uncharacterized protein LOC120412994 [Culex pipiens pallens]|uniref:uncharacterized protein LOC120412994 n=1 Tax=Culex pipiens pallens TaxID=42434 RepID=UPI001954FDBF|nr:uncharacterized protein LOC120412994 [Culex pipiens pallens]